MIECDLLQSLPLEDDTPPTPRKPKPPRQPSSFSCPQCHAKLGIGLQKKRTHVQCPECGNEFVVQRPPLPSTVTEAKAAAEGAAEAVVAVAAAALQLRKKEEKQSRCKQAERGQRTLRE